MYFGTKNYLKSNHYHTPKHPLNQKPLCIQQKLVQERKKNHEPMDYVFVLTCKKSQNNCQKKVETESRFLNPDLKSYFI